MADQDQDQKTEEPTQKRLDDARARGEVAMAPEVRHALMFVAAMVATGGLGGWCMARLGALFVRLWGSADDYRLDPDGAQNLTTGIFAHIASSLAPLAALFFGCAFLTLFLQGRPTLSWSRVRPKWSKLSPMSGLNRLLGKRAMVEFAKTLAKFAAIAMVATIVIRPHILALDQLVGADAGAIGKATDALVFRLVKAVGLLVVLLALFDFFYQRRAFLKRMRMSLQELRDEFKNSEGDPRVKARIRAIQTQRARRRMMAAVPDASVIITNPTHYAVALKYEHGAMAAPVVVAKGVDAVALKIREVAAGAHVPIVESPPLARALHASVEIDRPIPVEHYAAVAEIIGYVMRLARHVV